MEGFEMTRMTERVKPEAEDFVAECFEILGPPEESGIWFSTGPDGVRWLCQPIRNNDPLGDMHADGAITDLELLAGRKWQACYIRLEASFWTGDEKSARQQLKELKRMTRAVGSVGALLRHDVLG
jgi:hypothetical protein